MVAGCGAPVGVEPVAVLVGAPGGEPAEALVGALVGAPAGVRALVAHTLRGQAHQS